VDKASDIMQGRWLRLLYCYPDEVTEELIDVMLKHDSVCKYMDIPIQHFSDNVLKNMNRRHTLESTRSLVKRLHSAGFTLRTSLIVGFPGETEEDFQTLLECVKELKFERLGVFKYSPEEGTKAADMPGQVPEDIKTQRYEAVMELQQEISKKICAEQVGIKKRVLIDGFEGEIGMYIGRTMEQAPSVDGITYISSKKDLTAGSFHDVLIKDSSEYDLLGEIDEYC
jgi:ribosomal protein S12 methylthiotransferase